MNLARFDLVSLRLLVAVVDAGSLTGGAERLAISLAAASKRIADLESGLGTVLLERRPGGVTPTAAGRWPAGKTFLLLRRWRSMPRLARIGTSSPWRRD